MKYTPKIYARALAEAIAESPEKESLIIRNFLGLVTKNGDASKLQKIADLAGELVLAKAGHKKITVESARPLKKMPAGLINKISNVEDVIESKINPALVAGIRVTINKELEWDGSLAKKLQNLFNA